MLHCGRMKSKSFFVTKIVGSACEVYSLPMRQTIVSISLLCVLMRGSCNLAQTAASEPSKFKVETSIHEMYLADESEVPAAKPGGISPITYEEYKVREEARRQQVRAMLAKGEVKTGEDFRDASFIFQHSDNADDYLMAHILAVESVIKGDDTSKWIAAATLDRYLQSINKPQVFGTQYPLDPNAPASLRAEQAKAHAGRFKGRTQSPFDDQLVPDALRKDFCVPDLAQQKKNLATLNAGSYPGDAMVAPGCKR